MEMEDGGMEDRRRQITTGNPVCASGGGWNSNSGGQGRPLASCHLSKDGTKVRVG